MGLILFLLAFGPSLVWMYWLYTRDKFHREPLGLTALMLVGGGIISVTLTLIFVPLYAPALKGITEGSHLLSMFFFAALPEEVFKMLPVFLFAWRSRHWDEPFDGIVYAGASALGFHLIETAKYMFEVAKTVDGSLFQGLIRGAKPGHMLYGITMGYFLGKARFAAPKDRPKYFALALAVPVALHTAWNTASSHGGSFVGGQTIPDYIFALSAWGISVALWLTAFRFIKQNEEASPWNPKAWTVPMAATGCPSCGGGYPASAVYCQTCGAPVQAQAPVQATP
jgi:RsiW-degrading membrane proteinase PrsW (M82 family)